MNRSGVPKPRAQQGRKDGWSVSTIRAVLTRPLYRGELVYGRTQKAYDRELRRVYRDTKRETGHIRRPEDTWIRREVPELRIVDVDLAVRVDERLQDLRQRYLASLKRSDGRAPEKAHGKYLLSGGMLICPTCGGHFERESIVEAEPRDREAPPQARPRRASGAGVHLLHAATEAGGVQ